MDLLNEKKMYNLVFMFCCVTWSRYVGNVESLFAREHFKGNCGFCCGDYWSTSDWRKHFLFYLSHKICHEQNIIFCIWLTVYHYCLRGSQTRVPLRSPYYVAVAAGHTICLDTLLLQISYNAPYCRYVWHRQRTWQIITYKRLRHDFVHNHATIMMCFKLDLSMFLVRDSI